MRSIVVYPRDPAPEPEPAPALITLDLPIPSIPLLGPILTQLIAGRPTSTTTTPTVTSTTPLANSPTTSATPQTTSKSPATTKGTAASSPTSASSGSGSSGNSGSSNSNSGSGSSSGSGNSAGSNTNSGSSSSSGSSDSNGNSNSNSESGSTSGSSSSSSSPQNSTNGNSGTSGNSNSNSTSGNNNNNLKNENISIVNNNLVAISSNANGKLTTSTIVAGVGGVDNLGTLPSGIALSTRTLDSGSKTVVVITPTLGATIAISTGGGHGASPAAVTVSAGSGSASGSNGTSNNAGSGQGSHLAAGAIVGIIAGVILILLLVIGGCLALKRRSYQHKREQRLQAWGIGWWKKSENRDRGIGYTASRESRAARSSFGSMVDRGLRPVTPLVIEASSNGHDLESGTGASVFYSETHDLHDQRRRDSITTDSSETAGLAESSSRTLANEPEYLYVTDGRGYLEAPQLSPISVRPFSPSETFSFPQPPQSTTATSLRSAGTSRTSYTFGNDPFADPSGNFTPSSPPPSPPPPPPATRIETIQRPFVPTLPDELSVKPGDKFMMLKVYDDGWAKIRRFNKDDNKSEEGLIPVDCLREKGENVPAFLAAKRISSYYASADSGSIGIKV